MWEDVAQLIDKFSLVDIADNMKQLLAGLEQMARPDTPSYSHSSASGPPLCLQQGSFSSRSIGAGSGGCLASNGRGGGAAASAGGCQGQGQDYSDRLQLCTDYLHLHLHLEPNQQYLEECAELLEQFDMLAVPPFPPPPITLSSKLGPLPPLPFKPPLPVQGKYYPKYRRWAGQLLGEQVCW